jgi:tetratricopeptide (TPR) repeat protein
MKSRTLVYWFFIVLLYAAPLSAKPTAFIEVYTYQAGDSDSKLTCRSVSLIEVKRLLLEKIGTYLESRTEVKNFKITSDQIVALTAGIVRTEILREDWNGEIYRLTAQIEADPADLAEKIEQMRRNESSVENARRLAEVNESALERMREMQEEMERVQSNLIRVNQDLAANQNLLNVWGLVEDGVRLRQWGRPEEAIDALSAALVQNPSAIAYHERGKAYLELNRYSDAVEDFTEALKLEPGRRGTLFSRGMAYWRLKRRSAAAADMQKAAALGQGQAKKWLDKHDQYK